MRHNSSMEFKIGQTVELSDDAKNFYFDEYNLMSIFETPGSGLSPAYYTVERLMSHFKKRNRLVGKIERKSVIGTYLVRFTTSTDTYEAYFENTDLKKTSPINKPGELCKPI